MLHEKGPSGPFSFSLYLRYFSTMKKFFLFKRKDVSASSSSVSDNGEGLDILAVAADSLAFMTASLGRVHIVFNNATIYEENNLLDGESLKKTSVSVACEEGKEASVIESIMKFVSSEKTTTNIMRFDAVEGKATIGAASVSSFTDVVSEVKQLPTIRTTQEVSKKTFIGGTAGTALGTGTIIADIDFGEGNKPVIDLNETGLSESGGNVNGWTNNGSGGSTHNIGAGKITGTIPLDTSTGRSNNGLTTQAADMSSGTNFELDNTYTQEGPFTMFAVIGRSTSDIQDDPKLGSLVQGTATSGGGLTFMFTEAFDNNNFNFKFQREKGAFIKAPAQSPIIDASLPASEMRTAYVFVIRRDALSNIHVYDTTGSVAAFVPANTEGTGRTDTDVIVEHLGNGQGEKFQGNLARFGVIDKDIGSSAASQLALDLTKKYTPIT